MVRKTNPVNDQSGCASELEEGVGGHLLSKKKSNTAILKPVSEIPRSFPQLSKEERDVFEENCNSSSSGVAFGFDCFISTDEKYHSMNSILLHSVNMKKKNLPEVVLALGPLKGSSPFTMEDFVSVTTNTLKAMRSPETLISLAEKRPGVIVTRDTNVPFEERVTEKGHAHVRAFYAFELSPEQKRDFIHRRLRKLAEFYNDYEFDFIYYVPGSWLH